MKESSTMKNKKKKGGGRILNPNPNINNKNDKKQNTNNDNETTTIITTNVSLLMSLPLSLRMMILNLLDGRMQEELRQLPLVSKQFKKDCYQDVIKWKFIPLLEIGRIVQKKDKNEENGRKVKTFEFYFSTQPDFFQHYVHMIVHDFSKFLFETTAESSSVQQKTIEATTITIDRFGRPMRNTKLKGILSLDLYSKSSLVDDDFPHFLSSMLPNLLELNLKTNVESEIDHLFQYFSDHCPDLEKITIPITDDEQGTGISLDLEGIDMQNACNLRDLYIDGVEFTSSKNERNGTFTLLDPNIAYEIPDDKEYRADYCILHFCSKSLERLSMRNAKYSSYDDMVPLPDDEYFTIEQYNDKGTSTIPQSALIKFIRNVVGFPSLCWFRSDLSKENRDMLRLERPGIEFC